MIATIVICILLFVQPCSCRFYRNIPLPRGPQRVVQIETVAPEPIPTAQVEIFEDDDNSVRPLNRIVDQEQLSGGSSHLMLLRPDYTFRKVASLFRNFFDKRMGSVSERKRRTGNFLGL